MADCGLGAYHGCGEAVIVGGAADSWHRGDHNAGSGDYEALRTDAISLDVVSWALPYRCFQSIGTGGGCTALAMSALFTGVNAEPSLPLCLK